EDRPHPVHRLRRLPPRQALRPAAGAARPPAAARGTRRADPRRLPPHPDGAGALAHQAVRGPARHGRHGDRVHRRLGGRHRRPRRRHQRQ
ncbi:MAG: ATP-dependent hsl protease ATP-binding subunit HslU, partial [uncultured Acetobacteraceae bacterium]